MNFFPLTLFLSGLFLVVKIANAGVRFSDTNIYFYTAVQLLKGKVLYKDIFFTNLPLFPYLSSIYVALLKNITLYYITAAFEVVITGLLIYFIIWKKTKNSLVSFFAHIIYLGSFLILSTSDHQTGVFLASFLSVIAYILYDKKKHLISGILLGLTVLIKAYYLPVFLGFLIYSFLKNKKSCVLLIIGFFIATTICILPFIIFSRAELIKDVYSYSVFRTQGIDKIVVLAFFIAHDPLLVFLLFFNLFNARKNLLFGLIIFLSILFLLFYKDVYYLYLNIIVPFLVLAIPEVVERFKQAIKKYSYYLVVLIMLFTGINVYIYFYSYATIQRVFNIVDIIRVIKNEKPKVLYGIQELAPALSYLTNIPLIDGIIDTNENLFNNNVLNAKKITKNLISKEALVILKGVRYSNKNIYDPILTNIVDKTLLNKQCYLLKEYPVNTEGIVNRITIFSCKKTT